MGGGGEQNAVVPFFLAKVYIRIRKEKFNSSLEAQLWQITPQRRQIIEMEGVLVICRSGWDARLKFTVDEATRDLRQPTVEED